MRGNHGGLDGLDQLGQVARQLDPLLHHLDRRVDRAAIGVAEDHDERRAQELDGIFQACEAVIVEEICRRDARRRRRPDPDRTRVRAGRGCRRSRGSRRSGYCASARSGTAEGKVASRSISSGRVAGIALHQQVERFGRRHRIRGSARPVRRRPRSCRCGNALAARSAPAPVMSAAPRRTMSVGNVRIVRAWSFPPVAASLARKLATRQVKGLAMDNRR